MPSRILIFCSLFSFFFFSAALIKNISKLPMIYFVQIINNNLLTFQYEIINEECYLTICQSRYNQSAIFSHKLKATIHQPQYFPYAGFFHKLSLADIFVILDDAQYDKRFTNRNKIIATNDWIWITVPINKDHKFLPNIFVEINNNLKWKEVHWKKIYQSYANTKHFKLYRDYLHNLYKKEWNMLFDLDFETLKKTIDWLGIKIEIVRSSELKANGRSTERLVNICKEMGADTYVSGKDGRNYMDEKLFEKNNIKLEYQHYVYPQYQQHLSRTFVPDLSIIDMLANVGPDCMRLINETNSNLMELKH